MALFSSVFRRVSERLSHLRERETHTPEELMEERIERKEAGKENRKETLPLLVEVKPRPSPVRSSVLKPVEEESSAPPSLPCVPLYTDPPKPLPAPPRPTPASDDLFSLRRPSSQGRPPKRLPPIPTPRPSPIKVFPHLTLIDMEDEESEDVEHTGKTFQESGVRKSERLQTPEAEGQPEKVVAWLERKEREREKGVQEEVWASEVEELRGLKNEENVQEEVKRKGPFFLFAAAEKKVKKQREKKIMEENRRQRKRELLLERLMGDPKLKHLWINRHNLNCTS